MESRIVTWIMVLRQRVMCKRINLRILIQSMKPAVRLKLIPFFYEIPERK